MYIFHDPVFGKIFNPTQYHSITSMEQRQREIFEEFKRDIAQRNREFDRDIKELERAVGRQFTEALAYANGDIPLKQFMDTACEISEISDYLLDKRMISVDRLPPSDLKEIFPLISLTNAKTPWTEEVVTVPISSKLGRSLKMMIIFPWGLTDLT